jgi:plasmid stabilization system protein ParE
VIRSTLYKRLDNVASRLRLALKFSESAFERSLFEVNKNWASRRERVASIHPITAMPEIAATRRAFDLTPHPRILPMLGEIVLPQWKCLAELLDNSVDGFLEAARAGSAISAPHVHINLPTDGRVSGQISVRDNGPGMDADTLEKAARAGWTSHDPINNLGLFGMGFNIATARLGSKTTIWTTRSGDPQWVGMQIDFEQLGRAQAFETPVLSRAKMDHAISGTEIVIEKMKPEQREWFARGQNRTNVGKFLGRTYSAMLAASQPIGFRLEVNGAQVRARTHCIWGGPGNTEPRSAEHPHLGTIDVYQPFDFPLAPRQFCVQCWNWLGPGQGNCPQCGADGQIVSRQRRVHGWIGLQRYLDTSDFGIDFLRNGRKIEIGNKDLFFWYDADSDTHIPEYSIDDPRGRGRIVGEIHIDHCRVPYTKDRFVREDTAWAEMVQLVRGDGPLQPQLARDRGFGENTSPLYKLFQVFRRTSPHNKKVGGWRKLFVVEENDMAMAMARRFENGEPDYQGDAKWFELAKKADERVLTGGNPVGGSGSGSSGGGPLGGTSSGGTMGGIDGGGSGTAGANGLGANGGPTVPPSEERVALPELTQLYIEDSTNQRFDLKAFAVSDTDPGLPSGVPWAIWKTTAGPWEFLVRLGHPVFSSITMTAIDALLVQLAWQAADFTREQGLAASFAQILAALRARYAKRFEIDPAALSQEAERHLEEIARHVVGKVQANASRAFFDGLGQAKDQILLTMARRGVRAPQDAVEDGRFLQYSPPRVIRDFVIGRPELFFDGNYWEDGYSGLDFGSEAATAEARAGVLSLYQSLLTDAVWLAEQGETELSEASREHLLRASASVQILAMGGTDLVNAV